MNMKLYELSKEYCDAMHYLNHRLESGIIDEQTFLDTLEGASGDVETKMLNTARYIATLDAEAAAIKAVEDARKAERQRIEKQAERLRNYLAHHCSVTGIVPKAADIALGIRKSTAVKIANEDALPADYWRETIKREPDKTAISKAIKEGFSVPGAELENRTSITIK